MLLDIAQCIEGEIENKHSYCGNFKHTYILIMKKTEIILENKCANGCILEFECMKPCYDKIRVCMVVCM